MKTKLNLLPGSKARQAAFALVCLMLVSGGWAAKMAVDRLGEIQDELANDLAQPSEVYLWLSGGSRVSSETSTKPVPVGTWRNEAPPPLDDGS